MQGLLSALLNPKLGVFFLTLLPQFIAPGDAPAERAMQLALLFDAIGLAWLLLYAALLGAIGTALGRPGPAAQRQTPGRPWCERVARLDGPMGASQTR